MIKMIKPVVNISKVIEPFEAVVVGLFGVLYDGKNFRSEAIEALKSLKRSGRKIILLSNTSLRVQQVVRLLNDNKIPVMVFDAIVTRDFENELVPAPATKEIKAFEDKIQPIFETILNNCKENVRLAELRDTLLPRLMSGELSVADLGDGK